VKVTEAVEGDGDEDDVEAECSMLLCQRRGGYSGGNGSDDE